MMLNYMNASRLSSEFLKIWLGGTTAVISGLFCAAGTRPLLALMIIRGVGA
jgi:hypothetical protein